MSMSDETMVHLIQITDFHVTAPGTSYMNNFQSLDSLQKVVQAVQKNEPASEFIICTGDLTNDGTESAYNLVFDAVSQLQSPDRKVVCLPGNHDDAASLRKVMEVRGVTTSRIVQLNNFWVLILLDTEVPGSDAGKLRFAELDFLRNALDEYKGTQFNCLIAMHHHPTPIHSQWMDELALENKEEFFDVLQPFGQQVKGIIFGHVHQVLYIDQSKVKLSV